MHLCSAPNCQTSGCYKEHSEGRERNEKKKSKVSALERLKAQAVTKGGEGHWIFMHRAKFSGPVKENSITENPRKSIFDNTSRSFRSIPRTTFQVSEHVT